jgi:YVTN family beta-propeller protein
MVRWVLSILVLGIGVAVGGAQQPAPRSLLILNKNDATLVIVDPASGNIQATIPTGDGPHEIATSTDGKLAFVSNYGGQPGGRTISVIDLAARKELRRVDVSPLSRPHGLHFFGGKLYFTAENDQVVGRYDPATDKIDAQFKTGQATTHMVLISPDGRHMFTSNIRGNTVSIFDRGAAAGDWVNPAAITVGVGPEGLDVSPDGRELWSAHSNAQDGKVSVIDVAGRVVIATIDLKTRRSNRLKFTPDGARVLVTDLDTGQLVVVDAKARKETARVQLGRMVEGILISPDGSKAYIAENGDNTVAVVDLKTLEVLSRIKPGGGPDGMAWGR